MTVCVPPEELVGYGTMLQYKNPLTEDWVLVAGTRDLTTPRQVRAAIDSTDNTSGGWRTKIASPLKELEPVEYEMKFLSSQWFVIQALLENGTFVEWRLVLMDRRQFYVQFCAMVTAIADEIPMEELVLSTIELTPSGGPSSGYLN